MIKRPCLFYFSAFVLLLASCSREAQLSVISDTSAESALSVQQNLLVEFSEQLCSVLESGDEPEFLPGIISAERLFPDAGEWEPRHRACGLHRWYRITYDSSELPSTRAVSGFLSIPGVLHAEVEQRIKTNAFFNDPYAPQQWSLYNDGTLGSSYTDGADINVQAVWENYTAGNNKVIVAVLDSGVDFSHPDLGSVCIPAGPDGSKCFVQGRTGYMIFPDSHGTHVAGTIAAINNNNVGVCGIAGGSDGNGGVKILSCQFLHADEADPKNTLQGDSNAAMVWAADHGALISQNSWGTDYKTEADAAAGNIGDATATAINYFINNAGCDLNGRQRPDSPMKGGIVIFAAGNENWRYAWPAMYDKVIAVGAMTPNMKRASYSNYGDWVDIAAPGNNILSTVPDGYAYQQGTSMACPHVSGVAALIVSYFGGPGFTNEMLKQRLLGGANGTKLSPGYQIGPLVDALGSFTYGGSIAPEIPSGFSVTADSNRARFEWEIPSDADDGRAYASLLMLSKSETDLEDVRNLPESVIYATALTGDNAAGSVVSDVVSKLDFSTKYYAAVASYDIAGNFSAKTAVKQIHTPANKAPVITTDYAGDYSIHAYEIKNIVFSVTEPDNHDFTVSVEPGSNAFIYALNGSVCTVRLIGKNAPAGDYEATITATDEYGAATVLKIPYTLKANSSPEVVKEPEDIVLNATGQKMTIDMTEFIKDDDGETLKYTVSLSTLNIVHLNPDGNSLVVTALGYGMTSVTVTGEDAMGESVSVSFRVLVQDGKVAAAVYPNPVKDKLGIKVRDAAVISVTISNKAGAIVLSESGVSIDPFNPYYVNMKDFPGGVYHVKVTGNGLNEFFNVAKI